MLYKDWLIFCAAQSLAWTSCYLAIVGTVTSNLAEDIMVFRGDIIMTIEKELLSHFCEKLEGDRV